MHNDQVSLAERILITSFFIKSALTSLTAKLSRVMLAPGYLCC